ncbi:MAG: glycoside hydrolase 43 family protein [Asticcacaulis sp.]|nr:glycoside hydrolase 43 family protein [Asticcacaulis sp.]
MPGLPVLHSRDLVNWDFVAYAADKLDLGPAYRLEDGKSIYGQGFWAPCFRYHDGTFYIFSNVNGATTQMLTAKDPHGPWTRTPMKRTLHDLSVLFDDDGKVYVVWGYQEIHFAELDASLTDIVPGSERVLIDKGAGMGEGSHFYKFGDTYYITSAEWNGMRLATARSKSPTGPYEVNRAVSVDEDFGQVRGYRVGGDTPPFKLNPPNPAEHGWGSLHQGGLIQTPAGEWWGWSMYDSNSVGRLTALSPITWLEGWPYFGLPGNLTRTPRTWVKPNLPEGAPHAPYERSDDFSAKALKPIWQWNHVPLDGQWSLRERSGYLRLHTQPAADLLSARNSLTQRAIGPRSTPTVALDVSGLKTGDVAGLALLNRPYAWIGVERTLDGIFVTRRDEQTAAPVREAIAAKRIWLRADCDFMTEKAVLSYSTDGKTFKALGDSFTMAFQLKTFQGVRYTLFAFNTGGIRGGYADFDSIDVAEPAPEGLKPIPYGKTVTFAAADGHGLPMLDKPVEIVDRGLGRVSLKQGDRYLTVVEGGVVNLAPAKDDLSQQFQWSETLTGEIILMSLKTNRYLRAGSAVLYADSPGPLPDGHDGTRFVLH